MSLVDLEAAKLHLRVDDEDEDSLIQIYLDAAEQAAIDFLNRNVYADQEALDAAAEPPEALAMVVNAPIRAAVLLILGHLYANRENTVTGVSVQALPMGAHALLWPYRVGLGV